MNYTELLSYLENLLQDQDPSTDFTNILPAAIQDAEGRIYRELDFLATRTVNSGSNFTSGSRNFAIPSSPSTIIVVQGVAAISPAGDTAAAGTRNQLQLVSLDVIDSIWPNEAETGLPKYAALKDNANIVVAPTPDDMYAVELTGIFRPAYISSDNLTTYISLNYPDLLVAATMIFMTGWQRDFGAQSDDPKMALSWEATYQSRKQSALEEEQRRKGSSTGWSPFSQTLGQPPRT